VTSAEYNHHNSKLKITTESKILHSLKAQSSPKVYCTIYGWPLVFPGRSFVTCDIFGHYITQEPMVSIK